MIDTVAAILGSKRPRKRLTPDQRALLVERGRHFRFLRKEAGANEGLEKLDSTNGRQTGFPPHRGLREASRYPYNIDRVRER